MIKKIAIILIILLPLTYFLTSVPPVGVILKFTQPIEKDYTLQFLAREDKYGVVLTTVEGRWHSQLTMTLTNQNIFFDDIFDLSLSDNATYENRSEHIPTKQLESDGFAINEVYAHRYFNYTANITMPINESITIKVIWIDLSDEYKHICDETIFFTDSFHIYSCINNKDGYYQVIYHKESNVEGEVTATLNYGAVNLENIINKTGMCSPKPTCSLPLQWNTNNYTLLAIVQTIGLLDSHHLTVKMERRNIYYAYIASGATMIAITVGVVVTAIACIVYKCKHSTYQHIG